MSKQQPVLRQLSSYVPRRVLQRVYDTAKGIADGEDAIRNASAGPLPLLRSFSAALLFVDISGFTKLSEAYAERGTGGCEQFSLATNAYFGQMLDLILSYSGDVDCFAGDAVLVVFEASGSRTLEDAVVDATKCGLHLLEDLSPFQSSPQAPSLTLHCTIAAGDVQAVDTGSRAAGRFFTFLSGQPLHQLGNTHPVTKSGQCALSNEAYEIVGSHCLLESCNVTQLEDQCGHVISEPSVEFRCDFCPRLDVCRLRVPGRGAKVLWRQALVRALIFIQLRRYVPSTVWQRLEAGQGGYLAEHRNVGVLFVNIDLEGSGLIPFGVNEAQRLQNAIDIALNVVQEKWGGATRQITMDEKGLVFIFAFGLPGFQSPNYAVRAVRAALDVHNALLRSAAVYCGIGITTGSCYCGPVGNSALRSEYSVVGNVVNLAARIAGQASPMHEILACDDVKKVAEQQPGGDTVEFSHRISAVLKGVKGTVALLAPHEVRRASFSKRVRGRAKVALARGSNREPEVAPPNSAPNALSVAQTIRLRSRSGSPRANRLVGRVVEQQALNTQSNRVWESPQENHPHVALLVGPPGMGKSTLVDYWVYKCPPNVRILHSGAEELEVGTALFAFRGIVAAMLQWFNSEPLELNCLDHLYQMETVLDLAEATCTNPRFLELKSRIAEVATLPPSAQAARLKQLYVDLILVGSERTLLVLEDIHWLDATSWEVVTELSKQAGKRLFIVLTSRDEGDYTSPALLSKFRSFQHQANVKSIHIGGMASSDIRDLIASTLRVDHVDEDIAMAVQRKSSGNPLLVREIVFAFRDSGALQSIEGSSKSTMCMLKASSQLPPSLKELIVARIDRLPPAVALMVKVASVFGGAFLDEDLLEVHPTESDCESLSELLAVAESAHFLERLLDVNTSTQASEDGTVAPYAPESTTRDGATAWRFVHQLYREVSYGLLLHQQRRQLHAAVAQAMETRHGVDSTPVYSALARHWTAAVDHESPDDATVIKAVDYLCKAGDHAAKLKSMNESIRLLNEGWQLAKSLLPHKPAVEVETLSRYHFVLSVAYFNAFADDKLPLLTQLERAAMRFQHLLDALPYNAKWEVALMAPRLMVLSSTHTGRLPEDAFNRLEKAAGTVEPATACHAYAALVIASHMCQDYHRVTRCAALGLEAVSHANPDDLSKHQLLVQDPVSSTRSISSFANAVLGNLPVYERTVRAMLADLPNNEGDAISLLASWALFAISLNTDGFAERVDRANALLKKKNVEASMAQRWLTFADRLLEVDVQSERVSTSPARTREIFAGLLDVARKTHFFQYLLGLTRLVECWGDGEAAQQLVDVWEASPQVCPSELLRTRAMVAWFPKGGDSESFTPDWDNVEALLWESLRKAHELGHVLFALRTANMLMRAAKQRGRGEREAAYAIAGALGKLTPGGANIVVFHDIETALAHLSGFQQIRRVSVV